MDDALEFLKKDWKRKGAQLPKLSYDEIYKMLWKKSSSLVKWIFYISIFELILTLSLNLIFLDDSYFENAAQLQIPYYKTSIIISEIISLGILGFFMLKFYRNYKKITITDDAKTLMERIIKTRATVKNYIKVALSFMAFYMIFLCGMLLFGDTELHQKVIELTTNTSAILVWIVTILIVLIIIAATVLIFWLIYQLIYGILLKRLKHNYKELKKMEV